MLSLALVTGHFELLGVGFVAGPSRWAIMIASCTG